MPPKKKPIAALATPSFSGKSILFSKAALSEKTIDLDLVKAKGFVLFDVEDDSVR